MTFRVDQHCSTKIRTRNDTKNICFILELHSEVCSIPFHHILANLLLLQPMIFAAVAIYVLVCENQELDTTAKMS